MRGSGRSISRSAIIDTGGPCNHLAFSPDGRSFATGLRLRDHRRSRHPSTSGTPPRGESSPRSRCFRPVRLPTGRQGPRRHRGQLEAHGGRRPGHGRVLWTRPDLPGELGRRRSTSVPTVPRFWHGDATTSQCKMWLIRLDAVTGRQRGEPMRGLGRRWLSLPTAERSPPAVSRMARRTSMCSSCPRAGGRHPGEPAASDSPDWSSAPMGSHCSGQSRGRRLDGNNANGFGQIWDPATGRPTSPLMAGHARPAIYTPAGDRLVSAQTDLQAVASRARSRESQRLGFLVRGVRSLPHHPDGRTMLINLCSDRMLHCGRSRRMRSRLPTEEPTRRHADRERRQPPMAWVQCFLVRAAAGGWPDRRLAGRWCGRDRN